MDIQQLYQLIEKKAKPDKADIEPLKRLIGEYPYFQAGIFIYLKATYLFENEKFEDILEHFGIAVNDRKALFYYILSEEYDFFFQQTGKKEIDEDKTSVLLNAFFESRGDNDADMGLKYSISHSSLATTDYFTYMQATAIKKDETSSPDTETSELRHQSIIDIFITKSESEEGVRIKLNENEPFANAPITETNNSDDELDDDVFFTETLAKIYIKQKKYEKAYKIIKHLSLNYPKKNIYFADQLSFLEKLITNSKFKDIK